AEELMSSRGLLTLVEQLDAEIKGHEATLEQDRRAPSPITEEVGTRRRQSACGPEGRRFRDLFPHLAGQSGGWKSEEDWLTTVASGLADPRLKLLPSENGGMQASMLGGSGPSGGYDVPPEFFGRWLDTALEDEIVRSRADVRPMTSDSAMAVGWDGDDRSASLYGGFTSQWVAHGQEITPKDPKLRIIYLH